MDKGLFAPLFNLFKSVVPQAVKNDPARFNPITQVKAVVSLPKPQAQAYRQQVDKVVPRVQTGPQMMSNPFAMMAGQVANSVPNSVSGMAKLPAARTPGQFASDYWNIAQAPLAASALMRPAVANPNGPIGGLMHTKSVVEEGARQVAPAVNSTRPAHQMLIEQAMRNNDYPTVANIIKNIPLSDPYRQSMINLFGPILKTAGISL